MAVDDKLYFLGFMPDHFTGPNWTGPATYQSFDSRNSMLISNRDQFYANNSNGGSCFVMSNSLNYMLMGKIKTSNGSPPTTFNIVSYFYIHRSDWNSRNWRDIGTLYLLYCGSAPVVKLIPKSNTVDYSAIILDPVSGSVLNSVTVPAKFVSISGWESYELIKSVIYVSDWGTETSTIRLVHCSEDGLTKWFDQTFVIDSRDFSAIDGFSIGNVGHSYTNGGSEANAFYYTYACNFDPLRCTFDWYVENTVGSVNEWSGDTNSFLTSPITYDVDVHGLYTNSSNTTVTFARPRSFYFPDRHKARMVITQTAGFMGEMGEAGVIQPVVKNPTTGIVKPFGDNVTLNDTGGLYTWYSTIDPTTNNPWLKVDETNYEFGIKRIS